jgi:putative ABC transport system ATP-binding protein
MISIRKLEFHYRGGEFSLAIPELAIARGSTVAVVGPSGTGKTTLLNLMAAYTVPHAGSVEINGTCIASMSDGARRDFRLCHIGLVFQEFELLEYLSVLDNILLPYRISAALTLSPEVRARAISLAERVGIADKLKRCVQRLSQGERQRVAICRALLPEPKLILADEPTGNLDPANTDRVLGIIFDYVADHEATLVSVTHEHELLPRFERTVDLRDICPQI